MKVRVFGSSECGRCKSVVACLHVHKIAFDYIDALADDTQDFCDEQNVDMLPHVQVVNDAGKVVDQWVAPDEKAADLDMRDMLRVASRKS